MKKKKLWLMPMLMVSALALSSCSSNDDDSPTNSSDIASLQVTVVFEPGELGDRGYADGILTGIQQMEKADEEDGKNDIDTKYISLDSESKTQNAVQQWSNQRNHPFLTNTNYERRLLVLTKATQLAWINANSINENDEVLLLNTDKSVIANSALGDRIHVLNISAADAAEKYFQYIDALTQSEVAPESHTIGLVRRNDKQLYPDSIAETLNKHYGDQTEADILYFDDEIDLEGSLINASYRLATAYSDYEMMGFYFSIIDLGIANMGYDYYIYNNSEDLVRNVMLDAEPNNLMRFSIYRDFGKALTDWTSRWQKEATGSMPHEEWHGAWDGYTTDNIRY